MEKSRLTKLCVSLGIPKREVSEKQMDVYRSQKFDEDYLIRSMLNIDKALGGNVIVIGGFCACSKILGFRKLRRTSNDLDCVTNEEGIRLLRESFKNEIFQTTNYGDVFLEYNNIPVGFDIDETHGWVIPPEFFSDSRRFDFDSGGLTSISPEFLIALKARRSISKRRFYGKDALDTVNMILAPLYKTSLNPIDFNKLGYLIREHSSDSFDNVGEYMNFLRSYSGNLKKKEALLFEESLLILKDSTKKFY